MNEERLVEIETKLSFQEDLLQELNQQVYAQHRKIDRLEKLAETLYAQLRELGAALNETRPFHEKPPHY